MTVTPNDEKRDGGGPPTRAFTPARIVALVAIGLVVLALGYVHVASGHDSVSVPSRAEAGSTSRWVGTGRSSAAAARTGSSIASGGGNQG